MKIYFDNIEDLDFSNCAELSKNSNNGHWLTSSGTRLKRELQQLKIPYYKLDDIDEPGLYFVEVNGDPVWWTGGGIQQGGPTHILENLPNNIIDLVKQHRLRLIISADREGGGMIYYNNDGFLATTHIIRQLELPPGSVLITQGNRKIEDQYVNWLNETNNDRLFEVRYVNHFNRIFVNQNFPTSPVVLESIKNSNAKDYNSLNRTYKDHRSAHLYHLVKLGILNNGIVSANELRFNQLTPLQILRSSVPMIEYDKVLTDYYPRYVDGDWSVTNAANSVSEDIFKNSLISFITETKFDEDVVFLTEKVYKSLTYGHPMIVLSTCGTLQALRDLGYKTDWCGIDPSYNDIKDNTERFYKTHEILSWWINLSRDEKTQRIVQSLPTIEHNFRLSATRNFYYEDILNTINISKDYFK
jgi:hypothetical protein